MTQRLATLRLHGHLQMQMFGGKHTNRASSNDYFQHSVSGGGAISQLISYGSDSKWNGIYLLVKNKHVHTVKLLKTVKLKLFFPSELNNNLNRSQFISVHSTSCCHVHKNSVFVDSSRRVMMYWWTDKITQAEERIGKAACARGVIPGMCDDLNQKWRHREERKGVRFAFGPRPPTSGHKRGLLSCTRQIRVWPDLREGRSHFYCNGFWLHSAREGAQSGKLWFVTRGYTDWRRAGRVFCLLLFICYPFQTPLSSVLVHKLKCWDLIARAPAMATTNWAASVSSGSLTFSLNSRAAFLSKDVFFLQADVHLEILHNNANGSSVTLALFCVLRQRRLRYLRICMYVTHRKISKKSRRTGQKHKQSKAAHATCTQ